MYRDINGEISIMVFMVPAPGPSIGVGLFFIAIQEDRNAVTPERIGIRTMMFRAKDGVSPRLIPRKFKSNDWTALIKSWPNAEYASGFACTEVMILVCGE